MPGDGASFDDFEEDDGMDGLEDGEQTIDDGKLLLKNQIFSFMHQNYEEDSFA